MSGALRRSFAAMTLVVVSALSSAQTPDIAPRALSGPEVNPVVSLYVTGSYGGGSTASIVLGTDAWYETLLYAGDTGDHNLCMGGATGSRVGTAPLPAGQHPIVTWRIAVRKATFDGAIATVEVRWRREVDGNDVQPASGAEGAFTWRVSEGSTRVLDFVRQVPAAVEGCDTMGVDMSYRVEGAPELAQSQIAYDVWLLQRLPSGERRTQRFQTSARQGGAASFAFPLVSLEMPGKNGAPPTSVDLRVTGRVSGRVRRDGRIDLAVDAGRFVGPSGNRGIHQGNSGGKHLTVEPGETVEFTPPPLNGDNDGEYAPVLSGAPTAIRVRARRLW